MIVEIARGYGVSRDGRVFCSRPLNGKGHARTAWREVKPCPCSDGRYLQVGIDRKKYLVHRLVAIAFHGQPPAGFEAGHLDGDSSNNCAANLRWVRHVDNEQMKRLHGTSPIGAANPHARLTPDAVKTIRSEAGARGTQVELARRFGVSQATVSQIVSRRRWREKN